MKRSGELDLFRKKTGSLILAYVPPSYSKPNENDAEFIKREGVVMLRFVPTKANDENARDWDASHYFALSGTDAGKVLHVIDRRLPLETVKGYNSYLKLTHDNEGKYSNLSFYSKENSQDDSLSLGFTSGSFKFNMTLNAGEVAQVAELLKFAIPRMLGWDQAQPRTQD